MSHAAEKFSKVDWVLGTIHKMDAACTDSWQEWKQAWFQTYLDLGGLSGETGKKPCPMAAAFGLWRLGYVKRGGRPRKHWTEEEIKNSELGENAVYADIAVNLLESDGKSTPTDLWAKVRERYRGIGLGDPRKNQEGVASLVVRLHESGNIIS